MTSMHRMLLITAMALALPWLSMSCLGDIEARPATTTTVGAGGDGGFGGDGGDGAEGGEEGCISPPDGFCDETEDCVCTACAPAAGCMEGGCMANGFCELEFEDSCICSDCDDDADCLGLGGGNCTDDGVCDRIKESCACEDCFDEETCKDNQDLCAGGRPDGQCTPLTESCGCNDCLGAFECLCEDDAICDFTEPCVCPDCQMESFCTDPLSCTDDGTCQLIVEGCQCADCEAASVCP